MMRRTAPESFETASSSSGTSSSEEEGEEAEEDEPEREREVDTVQFGNINMPAAKLSIRMLLSHTAVCTSCQKKLNHRHIKNIKTHPSLGVLLCKHCHRRIQRPSRLSSVCRWSMCSGGRRIHCRSCAFEVCKKCCKNNFSREGLSSILSKVARNDWDCFICDPSGVKPHQRYATHLLNFAKIYRGSICSDNLRANLPYGQPVRVAVSRYKGSCAHVMETINSNEKQNEDIISALESHMDKTKKLVDLLKAGADLEVSESSMSSISAPSPGDPGSSNSCIEFRDVVVTLQRLETMNSAEIAALCPSLVNARSPSSVSESPLLNSRETSNDSNTPARDEAAIDTFPIPAGLTIKTEPHGVIEVMQRALSPSIPGPSTLTDPITPQLTEDEDSGSDRTLVLPNKKVAKQSSTLKTTSSRMASEMEDAVDEQEFLRRLLNSSDLRRFVKDPNKPSRGDEHLPLKEAEIKKEPQEKAEPFASSSSEDDADENEPTSSTSRTFDDENPLLVPPVESEMEDDAFNADEDEEISDSDVSLPEPVASTSKDVNAGEQRDGIKMKAIPSMPQASEDDDEDIIAGPKKRKRAVYSSSDDEKENDGGDYAEPIVLLTDGESDDSLILSPKKQSQPQSESRVKKTQEREKNLKSDHSSDSDVQVTKTTTLTSPKKQSTLSQAFGKSFAKQPKVEVISSEEDCEKDMGTQGRKNIRPILDDRSLTEETRNAAKEERERRERIEELQKKYNESEARCVGEPGSSKCILEFDDEDKPLVEVHPSLAEKLKTHQHEGVKFLYKATIEKAERVSQSGSGAILAHCMGLGKTFQVITFLHTIMTHPLLKTHIKTVLVLCPFNVTANWKEEIHMWITRDNRLEEKLNVHHLNNETVPYLRASMLSKWQREGGILIASYQLLVSILGSQTAVQNKKKKKAKKKTVEPHIQKKYNLAFCDPGPNMVIIDEGHMLKNNNTQMAQVVDLIPTKRKMVLSGTPLQNNLTEYHTMIGIVKPGLLGTKNEFKNRFRNPIVNGQYNNSTQSDVKLMRRRACVLHDLLDGCVHRRGRDVIEGFLPPRKDYVITVRQSDLQEALYSTLVSLISARKGGIKGGRNGRHIIGDYIQLRTIWTHPYLLTKEKKKLKKSAGDFNIQNALTYDSLGDDEDISPDWYKAITKDTELNDVQLGPKFFLLFDIIHKSELIGDKVIVFSQHLATLNLIEELLKLLHDERLNIKLDQKKHFGTWLKDWDYFRLDGSTPSEDRQRSFKRFNDMSNHRARLFLVSTRAGNLGANMVGGNRMVLLDTSWNPSQDNQAVYRLYRIGQLKPVYVYRFVAFGTMEEKMYQRNVLKESTSSRVLDEHNINNHYAHTDIEDLYTFVPYKDAENIVPNVPKDLLLAEVLSRHKGLVVGLHEHDHLLQNQEDDNLTDEDRKQAWEEYEAEKRPPPPPPPPPVPPPLPTQVPNGGPQGSIPEGLLLSDGIMKRIAVYEQIMRTATCPLESRIDAARNILKCTVSANAKCEIIATETRNHQADVLRSGRAPDQIILRRMQLAMETQLVASQKYVMAYEFINKGVQTPIPRPNNQPGPSGQ